ncbi:MAG TPA: alcohol dehydrogenase, partial [Deltaproteobacteria bacterium]|nr:alcohol dehydrogenase [Deltaproteobacteria bacterium]
IGEANIPLGIDAVAGKATSNLAETLSEGGTVVNYGLLSGEPCQLTPDMIVFKGITLTGFWLAKKLGSMSLDKIQETYKNLASKIINGDLYVPVEAIYDLGHFEDALRHAYRGGRNGKILFAPNG